MFDRIRDIAAAGLLVVAQRLSREPQYVVQNRIAQRLRTAAGVMITADTAVKISAVWACLRYLSQTVAVLPWRVMRETKSGAEIQRTHPVDWLLWKRVSAEWSSFQFRETLTHWALRHGNGYAEIEPDQLGRPFSMWPIHPDRVHCCRAIEDMVDDAGNPIDAGSLFYEVNNGIGGKSVLAAKRMFHIRGFGEGPVGVNVIAYAAESLGWSQAAQLFGATFFGNGATPATVVINKKALTPDGLKKQKAEFEQLYKGPRNSNKTAHTDNETDIKTIGINAKDSQLIETHQHLVEEVCFVAGTEVITPWGPRSIESIEAGEWVLTHKGRWRRVTNVMSRSYVGPVVTVRSKGLEPVTATSNHPFYALALKRNRNGATNVSSPQFLPAGSLVSRKLNSGGDTSRVAYHGVTQPKLRHDTVITAIDLAEWMPEAAVEAQTIRASGNGRATPCTRHLMLDYDFGWICGLYAADGAVSQKEVLFYLGEHEVPVTEALEERLKNVFGIQPGTSVARGVARTVVWHRVLARLFADFGKAQEKRLPGWCMAGGSEFRRGLVDGLVAGDGCVYEQRTLLRSTSRVLIWQTRVLLWSVGLHGAVSVSEAGSCVINGRECLTLPMVSLEWRANPERNGSGIQTADVVGFRITDVDTKAFAGTVYNLEVEEDESYTTVGGCVHNCRWFGVPPHKVMHLLRATFSNIEAQAIEVVVDSVTPWVKRFEDEADYKLFGQNRSAYYTKMNMRALMRGDSTGRATFYKQMFDMGAYSPNRILQLEDENTIGTDGDKHLVQLNLTTLEKAGEQPAPSQQQTPPPANDDNPPQGDATDGGDAVAIAAGIARIEALLQEATVEG